MSTSNAKISIIFPTYNGEDSIEINLKSMENFINLNEIEVIIIDNNSSDSTVDIINKFKNKINIKLIENKENLGFSKACNLAVALSKAEFIYITNQDVIFPRDFFIILLELYKKLKKDREVLISPAVVFPGHYINYFGAKIHFLGFSYTPNMYQIITKEKKTFKTLKAAGCSMFMKREIFPELHGFDPFFFMYHEDTDFSLKAIRSSIYIYTTNETSIIHQKIHMSINEFTYYYIERNRFLVIYKNVNNLKKIIPYLIVSELMLLFQAVITNRIKLRLKIYKFLILNYKKIRKLRLYESNIKDNKIDMKYLDKGLDPIILGKILSRVKILRIFLKMINLIL